MKFKFLKFIFLFALSFSLLFSKTSAATELDPEYQAALQSALDQLRITHSTPGMSAAVILPEGLWVGASGISDSTDPLTYNHSFGIGSITKNIVAATVLRLQEKNLLNINDPIHMYLPRYNNIDSNITIKQLLQHTSGIYNFTDNPQYLSRINADMDSLWNSENVLYYVLTPNFVPGTSWKYSNTNYVLLGLIIEKVYKKPLEQAYRDLLLTNNFLSGLYLWPYENFSGPLVHNWVDLNGDGILDDASIFVPTALYSSCWAAGAIITQPQRLGFYAMSLFNGSLLSPESMQQMTTFRNISFGAANGYGLGLMRYNNVAGRTIWGHGGNVFGYASIMMHAPSDSITVIVCANKDLSTTGFGLSFMNSVITTRPVGIKAVSTEIPEKFALNQNYPNPFNPETTIEFTMPANESAKLEVFDINGRLIQTLVNEKLSAGAYRVKWNGKDASSGIYYYTLRTENFSETKKMILVK